MSHLKSFPFKSTSCRKWEPGKMFREPPPAFDGRSIAEILGAK
jgi:hypothetical protein